MEDEGNIIDLEVVCGDGYGHGVPLWLKAATIANPTQESHTFCQLASSFRVVNQCVSGYVVVADSSWPVCESGQWVSLGWGLWIT
jgi:hypothetical protein